MSDKIEACACKTDSSPITGYLYISAKEKVGCHVHCEVCGWEVKKESMDEAISAWNSVMRAVRMQREMVDKELKEDREAAIDTEIGIGIRDSEEAQRDE